MKTFQIASFLKEKKTVSVTIERELCAYPQPEVYKCIYVPVTADMSWKMNGTLKSLTSQGTKRNG